MINAYLMVSYEHEGKWITLETATLYETKVRTMVTTHAQHGGWCGEYIVDKEFEIRQEWKKKMINEGLDLNTAVMKVLEMEIWPTEKMIQFESQRMAAGKNASNLQNHPGNGALNPPKPSGEFSSGGPNVSPRRPSTGSTTTYNGRPSYRQNDNRWWRWENKRHEICKKWQENTCKYSAQDCNRAHGKEYLQPKQKTERKKGSEKGDKNKGNGKGKP